MVCDAVLATPLLEDTGNLPTFDGPSRSQPAPSPAARGRSLLETHFDLVRTKIERLSQRSGLPAHEAEELRSWALFKLVEDDYRILGRWEGRSSFSTYLTVVLVNLVRDYRIHVWGKWRPSAAARHEGAEAILLERLLVRDGLSLAEAIVKIQTEHSVSLPAEELERIAAHLPQRTGRRSVGEEELHRIPVDGKVEARLEDKERARATACLREALTPLLLALPPEDILLLKLHYRESLSIAAISRLLGRPQRELYSRRDRCLKRLRSGLEKSGLSADKVSVLLEGAT
jgi:RNA polymerase sigma factor (sigma-70 family)